MSPPLDTPFSISLGPDEALVLFDFLSRFEHDERLTIVDPSEAAVLSRLLGALERHLVAPFDPRYSELLDVARARLRGSEE